MLLCALLAAAGLAAWPVSAQGCATIKDFIESNSDLYAYMSEAYPKLEEPDVAVTLFAPILTNVTALQAAAYPQLLLDIILPEPTELRSLDSVMNAANGTILLEDDPGKGVIHATFVDLGGAIADIIPVAFPLGKSVSYMITPMSAGSLPAQVGAGSPPGA
ncbi:hypothetical protein ABPG77_010034 [Micractinium sp. CCAP 211/92]